MIFAGSIPSKVLHSNIFAVNIHTEVLHANNFAVNIPTEVLQAMLKQILSLALIVSSNFYFFFSYKLTFHFHTVYKHLFQVDRL